MFKFRKLRKQFTGKKLARRKRTEAEINRELWRKFQARSIAKGDWHVKETYRTGEDGIQRGPYYAIQRRNHSGKVEVVYVGQKKIKPYELTIINEIWGGGNHYVPTGADIRILLQGY